jgi:hypothetical protein
LVPAAGLLTAETLKALVASLEVAASIFDYRDNGIALSVEVRRDENAYTSSGSRSLTARPSNSSSSSETASRDVIVLLVLIWSCISNGAGSFYADACGGLFGLNQCGKRF